MPFHYIYKITNDTTNEYYYGVRSCFVDWQHDPYMGSGVLLNKKMKAHPEYNWTKEVLLVFDSAEEAYKYEEIILRGRYIGCDTHDGFCLNMRGGGVGGRATKRETALIGPQGQSKKVDFTQVKSFLLDGYSIKAESCFLFNLSSNELFRVTRATAETLILYHEDSWETGIPIGRENQEALKITGDIKAFCHLHKNKVALLNNEGCEIKVSRLKVIPSLKMGYKFKSISIRVYNKERGVWTRQSRATAKRLLLDGSGWNYGKPPVPLTKITAKDL